jgi:hypothetical protein
MGLSDPPDPQDEATFRASKLDWARVDRPEHATVLRLHRDLAALRKAHPALSNGRRDLLSVRWSEGPRWIAVERHDEMSDAVFVLVNFERTPAQMPLGPAGSFELALGTHEVRYGGAPTGAEPPSRLEVVEEASAWIECPGETALVYVRAPE